MRPFVSAKLLSAEQRIEFLFGLLGSPGSGGYGQYGLARSGLEVVTVVRGFLIPDPFRLGFSTLVVLARIIEPAVAARVQVGAAPRALISCPDAFADFRFDRRAAFPAIHTNTMLREGLLIVDLPGPHLRPRRPQQGLAESQLRWAPQLRRPAPRAAAPRLQSRGGSCDSIRDPFLRE
jgi:hypothetical protein